MLQLVDKLQQVGKIDNLQQVCGVFGCVGLYSAVKNRIKCWQFTEFQLFCVLLQLVDKLQQVGKIDNLQQVCGVFGCGTDEVLYIKFI